MSNRGQALILAVIILVAVWVTAPEPRALQGEESRLSSLLPTLLPAPPPAVAYKKTALVAPLVPKGLLRNWNVLDPSLSAAAALVYSLDDEVSLLAARAYERRPMASIAKLVTALLVTEEIGMNRKVVVGDAAVRTPGERGTLRSGEVFVARDLLRIMLLVSSNDAAAAFAESDGGREEFVARLNRLAARLGLTETTLEDATGLSPGTVTSAGDILVLLRALMAREPELLTWTRLPTLLIQPTNDPTSRVVENTNPFVGDARFLGGKTGTTREAGENFAGIFSIGNRRLAVIVLGSDDRVRDIETLLAWVGRAYTFD